MHHCSWCSSGWCSNVAVVGAVVIGRVPEENIRMARPCASERPDIASFGYVIQALYANCVLNHIFSSLKWFGPIFGKIVNASKNIF